jgi:hypothetical protein
MRLACRVAFYVHPRPVFLVIPQAELYARPATWKGAKGDRMCHDGLVGKAFLCFNAKNLIS